MGVAVARNRVWSGPKVFQDAAPGEPGRLNLNGDVYMLVFALCEVRRSYALLPARFLGDLVLQMTARGTLQTSGAERQRASLENEVACRTSTPASSLKLTEVRRTDAEALLGRNLERSTSSQCRLDKGIWWYRSTTTSKRRLPSPGPSAP